MRQLLLFCVLVANVFAKYQLSEISISNGILTLSVEKGALLYVQSNDDESLLAKIKITNNLSTMTALDLSKLGTNVDGTKKAWLVGGDVTISSTNTALDAAKLSGFVYYTTYTQAQDKNFLVYAVDQPQLISFNIDDLTVVFLNQKIVWNDSTNLKQRVIRPTYVPTKSSQVYGYIQDPNSALNIYWDEPAETYKNQQSEESKNSRIFSNPMTVPNMGTQFFDNVEPFQIFNDIWYLRSSGQIRFQVRPQWDNPNGTTTTKVTTTGFVMCLNSPENLQVNMKFSTTNFALTGLWALYNVFNPVEVGMSGFSVGLIPTNNADNNRRAGLTAWPSSQFYIHSNYTDAGRFAVQYYQIEGEPVPSTTPGPTTTPAPTTPQPSTISTTTVATTTKSASPILNFLFLVGILVKLM